MIVATMPPIGPTFATCEVCGTQITGVIPALKVVRGWTYDPMVPGNDAEWQVEPCMHYVHRKSIVWITPPPEGQ